MKGFRNIESQKYGRSYYVGYRFGVIYHVRKTGFKGLRAWEARPATEIHCASFTGANLVDISRALERPLSADAN